MFYLLNFKIIYIITELPTVKRLSRIIENNLLKSFEIGNVIQVHAIYRQTLLILTKKIWNDST